MKQFSIFLLTCCILTIVGCNNYKYAVLTNPQQKRFDTFLKKKKEASYRCNNDIQRNEFYKSFEKDLFQYLDTIPLFVNWQGKIKNIKTKQIRNSTELSFEVFYQPEEYREISFHCSHIIPNDSLSNDYLYNTVKNMPNYMLVFFDGYIKRNNNDEIVYDGYSSDNLHIPYPKYSFNFVFIDPQPTDIFSTNLKIATDLDFKIIEPLRLNYQKKISKAEADKRHKELLPQFEAAQSVLTEQEKQYSQRFRSCLINDFIFE